MENLNFLIKCAFTILKHVEMYLVLRLIKVSLGAGIRPLTEDEHLYLRLCKLDE
jgi:hypothetical protein